MSSHDCYIQGKINLRANIPEETVLHAFADFMEEKYIELDGIDPSSNEGIGIDSGSVSFFLNFCAMGADYRDTDCENLARSLSEISVGPNLFEFVDTDYSSSDGNKQIYAVGSEDDQARAKLQYAAEQFVDWAGGVLDKSVLVEAKQYLMALPTRSRA